MKVVIRLGQSVNRLDTPSFWQATCWCLEHIFGEYRGDSSGTSKSMILSPWESLMDGGLPGYSLDRCLPRVLQKNISLSSVCFTSVLQNLSLITLQRFLQSGKNLSPVTKGASNYEWNSLGRSDSSSPTSTTKELEGISVLLSLLSKRHERTPNK